MPSGMSHECEKEEGMSWDRLRCPCRSLQEHTSKSARSALLHGRLDSATYVRREHMRCLSATVSLFSSNA